MTAPPRDELGYFIIVDVAKTPVLAEIRASEKPL